MLYIEDFKNAYKKKRLILDIENEIYKLKKELKLTKSVEVAKHIKEEIYKHELEIAIQYGDLAEVEKFIDDCEDEFVAQAMRHKFLKGKTWQGVGMSLGIYNSEDSTRMMVGRYLNKNGIRRRPK